MMTIAHMLVLKDQEDLAGSPLVLLMLSIQTERGIGTLRRIFLHTLPLRGNPSLNELLFGTGNAMIP
jgi:hypothetical protein